jgi:hypothetical protein
MASTRLANDASGLAMRPVNDAGASLDRQIGNDASGLDIRPVNDAGASSYAQTGRKEASPATQSSNLQGLRYAQTGRKETSSAAHSGKSIRKRKSRTCAGGPKLCCVN